MCDTSIEIDRIAMEMLLVHMCSTNTHESGLNPQ